MQLYVSAKSFSFFFYFFFKYLATYLQTIDSNCNNVYWSVQSMALIFLESQFIKFLPIHVYPLHQLIQPAGEHFTDNNNISSIQIYNNNHTVIYTYIYLYIFWVIFIHIVRGICYNTKLII